MAAENTGGLRERKARRTREAISAAAIGLFLERGYDAVSVVDVAAAAEVSKRTLFKYFPAKEDLVLHRIADHENENAEVVRARPAGSSPLHALHRHFLDGLRRRDPVTGLSGDPEALALAGMIASTPGLTHALQRWLARGEDALAAAIAETTTSGDLEARVMAAQLTATQRCLANHISGLLLDGMPVQRAHRAAQDAADRAFGLLATGLQAPNSPS